MESITGRQVSKLQSFLVLMCQHHVTLREETEPVPFLTHSPLPRGSPTAGHLLIAQMGNRGPGHTTGERRGRRVGSAVGRQCACWGAGQPAGVATPGRNPAPAQASGGSSQHPLLGTSSPQE